jgi:hypothetical protein
VIKFSAAKQAGQNVPCTGTSASQAGQCGGSSKSSAAVARRSKFAAGKLIALLARSGLAYLTQEIFQLEVEKVFWFFSSEKNILSSAS